MLFNKKISVVIPCRNEEEAIKVVLQKIPVFVDEVIVVDNGSSDKTRAVAERLGAIVVSEKRTVDGVGYGYAHQMGMSRATGDIIFALDGDDTYPINKIREIVIYMDKSGSDFVSCSRFPLSNKAISPIRQLGVKILNAEVLLLYGYKINDILTGMWAVKRECISSLNVKSGDWNFSPEIKLSALMHPKVSFSEYHIAHFIRTNGISKQNIWKTGMGHLFYIAKNRLVFEGRFLTQIKNLASIILNPVKSLSLSKEKR